MRLLNQFSQKHVIIFELFKTMHFIIKVCLSMFHKIWILFTTKKAAATYFSHACVNNYVVDGEKKRENTECEKSLHCMKNESLTTQTFDTKSDIILLSIYVKCI